MRCLPICWSLFKTSMLNFKLEKEEKVQKNKKLVMMQLCAVSMTSYQHDCTRELSATRSQPSGPGCHVNQDAAPTPTCRILRSPQVP